MTIPSWFVIVMGLGTVFIGLISIIILCKLLGAVCSIMEGKSTQTPAPAAPAVATPAPAPTKSTTNRQEVIAAIGVAIAEELDVDVSAIRITSIKKI